MLQICLGYLFYLLLIKNINHYWNEIINFKLELCLNELPIKLKIFTRSFESKI